jgi:outer membrane receptor protein involved in Fe transport
VRTCMTAGLCAFLAVSLVAGPLSTAAAAQPHSQIAQGQSTGVLSGTVTDARGVAQGGASVTATGPGGTSSTTTDSSGRFSLNLSPGLYDVIISKGGFQPNETDGVGVVASSTTNLNISLNESSLSSLRVIGSVTTRGGNAINNRPDAVSTLNGDYLVTRVNPNLNYTVPELPGVTIGRGNGATPNTSFVVRGSIYETKTLIDGHSLSPGVFGAYNVNYANAAIFDNIEVVKGVGLNGVNAGESPVATVNLRTRDFTSTNQAYLNGGFDQFGGSYYNGWASGNIFGNKLSYVLAKSFSGVRGVTFGATGNRIGLSTPNANFNLNDAGGSLGLVQWQGDMSYPYSLEAELVKLRYRLSNTTSITAQFLGLQGQYQPQGASYASYSGYRTIAPCYTQGPTGAFSGTTDPTQCTPTSATGPFAQFNAPYASNIIGQQAQMYSWFPNSVIQNNEPYFSAELRTAWNNDTILIRPYTAIINRFISGAYENNYPGNGGGWFMVTNPANCQVVSKNPSVAAGTLAQGPCFQNPTGVLTNQPAFVNPGGPVPTFATTTTPLACSVANPCWTTPTAQENDAKYGYGTPFSQPEIDHLHGVTFQYIHPAGENLFGFSYDYNSDDTLKYTGDTTIPPAGCTPTVGSAANIPANVGYQPTCPLLSLPRTGLQIPPTIIRRGDLALTGLLNLTPQLQASVGAYLTNWNANYQVEDPTLTAKYGAQAPLSLIKQTRTVSHFDPQIGLTFRPSTGVVLRASGGTGVTLPFAGQISGLPAIDLPNGANNQTYTLTIPAPQLQPEVTVAYDLGTDIRLRDGGVFSIDFFNNTIHNVFITNLLPGDPTTIPGCLATYNACQMAVTGNGPIERNYGLETSLIKNAPVGFGYTATVTLQRAYLDQLPVSIYNSTGGSFLINGKQLDGGVSGSQVIPFVKGYGEVRYTWPGGGLFTFGGDWSGANNPTYGPGFVVFNSTVSQPIANGWAVQMAVDNLFNYNSGTFIGQATLNNGFARSKLVPIALPATTQNLVYSSGTSSLQIVPPRYVRLQLSKFIGRQ